MHTRRLLAATLLATAFARPALAQEAAQTGEETDGSDRAFLDTQGASRNRAANVIPWLPDAVLDQLNARIRGQRGKADDMVNPVFATPQRRTITIAPEGSGPVPTIETLEGYPTTISFIDITGQKWPLHWEYASNVYKPVQPPPQPQVTNVNANTNERAQADIPMQEAAEVAAVTIGHGFDFDIPARGLEGNSIVIKTMSPRPIGGMNLNLEKGKSPIAFQLRAGGTNGRFYDAEVVVRVLAAGPALSRPAIPKTTRR